MPPGIAPFRVDVTDATLDDLRRRLAATRFTDQIPAVGWDYGTDLDYLRDLVTYWHDSYDWRATEERLNRYEHYTTTIDGQNIHFLHAPSPVPDALPLVLTHGWPGSIIEFLDVIEPLRDPARHGGDTADAFHVVCPSLPGYAFSGPTRERGWHPGRVAAAWAELMARLGYTQYAAQGGDWGSFVTTQLALADPEHLAGIHLTMAVPNPGTDDPATFTDDERDAIAGFTLMMGDEGGYYRIQSTRPQTLGYALEDSPAGLCAWIVEKFRPWSDCDGEIERSFTRDQLLDNVMLYWVTATANSSTRLYFEFDQALRSGQLNVGTRVEVPTGYARYPKEIMKTSRRWAERDYNLMHFADLPRGGHFATMEEPELF